MDIPTPIVDAPKPPHRLRRVRIAVSVFFGVPTVALCVLWWRGRECRDYLQCTIGDTHILSACSRNGKVSLDLHLLPWDLDPSITIPPLIFRSEKLVVFPLSQMDRRWYFSYRGPKEWNVVFPHWFVIAIAGALSGAAGWVLPVKFSLRTMLIATTLVAVVLGLGALLAR
jgi:hypothetical protein